MPDPNAIVALVSRIDPNAAEVLRQGREGGTIDWKVSDPSGRIQDVAFPERTRTQDRDIHIAGVRSRIWRLEDGGPWLNARPS